MARAKSKSDKYSDDLLDDGVVRPLAAMSPEEIPEDVNPNSDRERRLAWLRAEIRKGLDEEAAGLGKEYHTWEELFKDVIGAGYDEGDEAIEAAADLAKGKP